MAKRIQELQPDVIVECYLEAKYSHYDTVDLLEFGEFNDTVENLLEEDKLDNIVTVQNAETDEFNLSINDNFQELENACPQWQQNTSAIYPKWLEHHQSRHLNKDPNCPVSMEEAGSRIAHRRKKGDRQPRVTHFDLATFEASTDGDKYCLVAAVTIELEKESKLQPVSVPMPKKDAPCALASVKEALTLCQDRNLHQITGSRIVRIQADSRDEFNNQKLKDLCWDRNIILSFYPAHQPSSNGIVERMVSEGPQSVEC